MTLPKAIAPGGLIIAVDLAQLQAVGDAEGLETGQFGWSEAEEAFFVARAVTGPTSTWSQAIGGDSPLVIATASVEAQQTNTTTTFATVLDITGLALAAGKYRVDYSFEGMQNGTGTPEFRLQQNGADAAEFRTDKTWRPASGFFFADATLTDVTLQLRTTNAAGTAVLRRARLQVTRIGS